MQSPHIETLKLFLASVVESDIYFEDPLSFFASSVLTKIQAGIDYVYITSRIYNIQ
jgi:hypothetical protein